MTLYELTHQRRFYALSIAFLCISYFVFQLFNNQYTIWSVDDFWFAHKIYQFKEGLPYRDFSPYKTVLGYYFLLPPMTLGHDALTPLLYTKHFIALINTGLFALTGYWLTRFFPRSAVGVTLILLMSAPFVLNYSTNIRVDLLAYWLCLFSALFLLDNAFLFAGITLGIAFLTSQKVLWYIVASNVALGTYWLIIARQKKIVWGTILFNLSLFIIIGIYIAIWSWFAGLHTVLYNMFYEAYIMFQLDVYDSTRQFFWEFTLHHNPFIFLLWPLTIITLFIKPKQDILLEKRIFIVIYASVILFSLISYKQVFPYYMLTTLPAFILLYTAFFSWLWAVLQETSPPTIYLIGKEGIWGLIVLYLFAFLFTNIVFVLPPYCLMIAFIPLLIGLKITLRKSSELILITSTLIGLVICLLGFIFPLIILSKDLQMNSRVYQKSMVQLTEALLKEGGDYLAGIELIYNKTQPIPGMRHLDAPAIFYLYQPTKKLASAMLASLYHTPDISINKALYYLDHSSVKFFVNNYRMEALPIKIKHYLDRHYAHFWGSIYLYAPVIDSGQHTIFLTFSGQYRVETPSEIHIDNMTIKPYSIILLNQGTHTSMAKMQYRLTLQDNTVKSFLNSRYKKDDWLLMLG